MTDPEKIELRGYLCYCVSFMPEVSCHLEGTDADICKLMIYNLVNEITCEQIPLSDMRAIRADRNAAIAATGGE